MRAEEIRELTDAEVRTRIAELEEEGFRLRFRAATETLEDPLRLRLLRKDVARMKTVLREREREAQGAAVRGPRRTAAKRASAGKKIAARKARASATRTTTKAAGTRKTARKAKGTRAAGAGER